MAADDQVKVVITAEDRASGVFSNAGISVGKLASGFALGQLAVQGFHTAVNAVQDFVVGSFNAFIDAEKEMTVANTALQNAFDNLTEKQVKNLKTEFGSVHVSIKQVEDAMNSAGEAAIQLGYDDEAASVAFAKLFQVSGSVKQANDDLALAMDLAAFSGRGLEESAAAVTKVHAGATRVLKEFGIEVKDGTTAEEALSLMHERTKDAAQNMSQSTAGQLKVLSIEWQNLQETVGGALAQAITPFIQELTAWAAKQETQQKIKEIVDAFAQFIKQIIEFMQKHWPEFKAVLSVMGLALQGLWLTIKTVWEWLQKALDMIDNFTNSIIKAVSWISTMIDKLQNLAKELAKGALDSVGNFGAALTKPIDKIIGVNDAVITPSGQVIQTDPADYLIATKNPGLGSVVINVTGTFLSETAAEAVGDMILQKLKMQLRI